MIELHILNINPMKKLKGLFTYFVITEGGSADHYVIKNVCNFHKFLLNFALIFKINECTGKLR